jgi:hypothetical protein
MATYGQKMNAERTQTREQRIINNTARDSCDFLAENSARTPN